METFKISRQEQFEKIQAENKTMQADIDKLENRLCDAKLENKTLKEKIVELTVKQTNTLHYLMSVEQSRDELLEVWKEYLKLTTQEGFVKLADSFKKAEQQKEETK